MDRCPVCGMKTKAGQTACEGCFADLPGGTVGNMAPAQVLLEPDHASLASLDLRYVGGLVGDHVPEFGGALFDDEGLVIVRGVGEIAYDPDLGVPVNHEVAKVVDYRLTREQMCAVAIEGPEELQRRVTLTRIVLIGIWAFAFRKGERRSYLVIECNDGRTAVFESRKYLPRELRATLSPWIHALQLDEHGVDETGTASTGTAPTAAERLREVTALHSDGLIDDEEFQAIRTRIIAEL